MGEKIRKAYRHLILTKDWVMTIKGSKTYEGTVVAAGWDRLSFVRKVNLVTKDNEDIHLIHGQGVNKFKPYLNHRVRVTGIVVSNGNNKKFCTVQKIMDLQGCHTGLGKPSNENPELGFGK